MDVTRLLLIVAVIALLMTCAVKMGNQCKDWYANQPSAFQQMLNEYPTAGGKK